MTQPIKEEKLLNFVYDALKKNHQATLPGFLSADVLCKAKQLVMIRKPQASASLTTQETKDGKE